MKKLLIALLVTVVATASVTTMAQSKLQLSAYSAAKIQRAQQLQQQERYPEAIQLLTELELSQPYDQAFVQRILGIFYWQQEQPQQAIEQLTLAVSSDLLADGQQQTSQQMLADILFTEQAYTDALTHYYQLIADYQTVTGQQQRAAAPHSLEQAKQQVWLRIAQAHYQQQQWQQVVNATQEYSQLATTAMTGSNEQLLALQLQLTAQSQLQQWAGAETSLQLLLTWQPNKLLWWQQLAAIQLRTGRHREALSTLELAQRQGLMLSVAERRTLAQLYAQQGIPEQAALVMTALYADGEREQATLIEQAQYWQQAKEWDKAISSWRQVVALTSESAQQHYRWPLAQLLLQQGNYRAALSELNLSAIGQGKSDAQRADIELAKVRAYYKLADLNNAIVHAKRALALHSSGSAKGWLSYLQQKRQHLAA